MDDWVVVDVRLPVKAMVEMFTVRSGEAPTVLGVLTGVALMPVTVSAAANIADLQRSIFFTGSSFRPEGGNERLCSLHNWDRGYQLQEQTRGNKV